MTGNPPTQHLTHLLMQSIPIESEHLAASVRDLIPLAEKGIVELASELGGMDPTDTGYIDIRVPEIATAAQCLGTAKQVLEQYDREREANDGLTPEQLLRQRLRDLVPFATTQINRLDEAAETDDDEIELDDAQQKLDRVETYLRGYTHEQEVPPPIAEDEIPF